MALTTAQKYALVSQLGLLEGIKAGLLDGDVALKPQIAALTLVSTANASDPATTQALANANKVAINAIIAALKA